MESFGSNNIIKLLVITSLIFSSASIVADNGKPDLWKVESKESTSYLFGSIHLGSKDMYPLSDIVNKSYNEADNLVVEINLKPGDEVKMAPMVLKHGFNFLVPLEQRLSAEGLAVYQTVCKEKELPCTSFSSYDAWLLSVQLSVSMMQQLGYQEELGIDKHFLKLAHQSNKKVINLETALQQFKMISGFNLKQQEIMLVQSLLATDKEIDQLFAAWKTGDDKAMIEMFSKGSEQAEIRDMNKALFDDRNIKMTEKISDHMKENKTLFVVVGAGHIVGDMGIVELLRKKGHKVTQIQ